MLLLADKELCMQLSRRMGERPVIAVQEPYAALEEMSRRNWPVVVLSSTAVTAAEEDFTGLCRASRRLQPQARLYAICPPRLETDVRALVAETVDEYFIHPLAPADLLVLTADVRTGIAAAPPGQPAGAGLSCGEVSRLVGATFSRTDLENCIAQMVSSRLHCGLEWIDEDPAGEPRNVLLRVGANPPRVLVADGQVRLDGSRRCCLPSPRTCRPCGQRRNAPRRCTTWPSPTT